MSIYKEITDEYFKLYQSFIESGFSEEQAFDLTKEYCNHVVADNISGYQYRRRNTRSNMAERLKKNMQERTEKNGTKNPESQEENL